MTSPDGGRVLLGWNAVLAVRRRPTHGVPAIQGNRLHASPREPSGSGGLLFDWLGELGFEGEELRLQFQECFGQFRWGTCSGWRRLRLGWGS